MYIGEPGSPFSMSSSTVVYELSLLPSKFSAFQANNKAISVCTDWIRACTVLHVHGILQWWLWKLKRSQKISLSYPSILFTKLFLSRDAEEKSTALSQLTQLCVAIVIFVCLPAHTTVELGVTLPARTFFELWVTLPARTCVELWV